MQRIQVWSLSKGADSGFAATPLSDLAEMDSEEELEELLSHNPGLLEDGLELVGRQIPASGGALDLLGVDEDGRLVVFELKRGTTPRAAVAQVVDYASYLAALDVRDISQLISQHSGKRGIQELPPFEEWYQERFAGRDLSEAVPPRMVLVGLGSDADTQRMVGFLANSGVNIALVLFQGFQAEGHRLLARTVEVQPPKSPGTGTRKGNEQKLQDFASERGVSGLLEDVRSYLRKNLPSAYEWPNQTAVSFNLPERTEAGGSSPRTYLTVAIDRKEPTLSLVFYPRAIAAAGETFTAFAQKFPNNREMWVSRGRGFALRGADDWTKFSGALQPVIAAMLTGRDQGEHEETSSDRQL